MPLWFASLTTLEPRVTGWFANADHMDLAIICRRDTGLTGKWLPMYALEQRSNQRLDLPHCYTMPTDAAAELENLYIMEMEDLSSKPPHGPN